MSLANVRKISAIISIFILVGCSKKVAKVEALPGVLIAPTPTPKPTPKVIKSVQAPVIAPAPVVIPTIYFEWDRFDILPDERAKLNKYANVSRETIRVEGHADESGSAEYNLALGELRARAVADYLQTSGIQSSDVVSYGEERPVHICGCKHPENRRVEIKAE